MFFTRRMSCWMVMLCCMALICSTFGLGQATAQTAPPAAETPVAEPAPTTPAADAEKKEEPKKEEEKTEEVKVAVAKTPMDEMQYTFDNFILFFCAVLVIFMQSGFALVETGLNAAKNAVNIMFKNFMDFGVGALLFFVVGYGIMYPELYPAPETTEAAKPAELKDVWFRFGGYGIPKLEPSTELTAAVFHPQMNFLFQVAFAATAATIVSGSVAGRTKFPAYLIYTVAITGLIYPVSGMWMWGGGWLFDLGMKDFAGSGVVHMVGGLAGLAGAIALGPRIGRYVNGKVVPMPGHNLPFATLGVFILLIGWYGFNPGSQLAFFGAANVETTFMVAVNTTLAACAGAVSGMLVSWALYKKPDLTLALNGMLAGLVGITANCHCVSNNSSMAIGAIAGVLVILAILALDKLRIDDPVGAFPVHGVCGAWGVIATALFHDKDLAPGFSDAPLTLKTQLIGVGAIGAWALGASLAVFYGLKLVGFLRVDAEEETKGLDICEHGMYAYPASQVNESYS